MFRYLCCLKKDLQLDESINLEEIKKFIPPIKNGRVIKVYDGDTITIVSKLPYISPAIKS